MLKHTYKKVVAVAAVLLSLLIAPAQNDISSPYSMYGIGLLSNVTSGAYDAMGKVGYAMQNPYLINFKNPASYVAFDSLSFIGDVAFSILSTRIAGVAPRASRNAPFTPSVSSSAKTSAARAPPRGDEQQA